jgi:hypothetical protein
MISNQVNARQAEIMSDLSTKGYNDYEINKNLVVTINLGIGIGFDQTIPVKT